MENETSNQVDESDLVRKVVHWLRESNKKAYNLPTTYKWFLPWQVDDLRMLWRETHTPFDMDLLGEQVVVSGDKSYKDPDGHVVINIADLFYFQFFRGDDVKKVLNVYKVFGCTAMQISGKEIDPLIKYCAKMDEKIVKSCKSLRDKNVKDIFQKMWVEMGGETIDSEDFLGNRVGYFRKVVSLYKSNQQKWHTEMVRLGLL